MLTKWAADFREKDARQGIACAHYCITVAPPIQRRTEKTEKVDEKIFSKKMENICVKHGISYEENPRKFCVEIGDEKKETKNGEQKFMEKIYGIFVEKFPLTCEKKYHKFFHVNNLLYCPSRQ